MQEAGLPESHELTTAVEMAVRESTARLTGVPVWAMDPNPTVKAATKQDEVGSLCMHNVLTRHVTAH